MSDRRSLAANGRVAHSALEGRIEAPRFTDGTVMRIAPPAADLCAAPEGARDKQMLRGWAFRVLDIHRGWAFGFDPADGYVGYLPAAALSDDVTPTHRVAVRHAHVYPRPDIKSREEAVLSFFAEVAVTARDGDFCALGGGGYICAQHLRPLSWRAGDAVAVAEMFLGTPYLWGGDTGTGIDCSGLVQMALRATGRECPRDSDQQALCWDDIAAGAPLRRGDLLFWGGHVALAAGETRLIHANAHHMAVVCEPAADAVARIEAQGDGPVTARKRPGGPI